MNEFGYMMAVMGSLVVGFLSLLMLFGSFLCAFSRDWSMKDRWWGSIQWAIGFAVGAMSLIRAWLID